MKKRSRTETGPRPSLYGLERLNLRPVSVVRLCRQKSTRFAHVDFCYKRGLQNCVLGLLLRKSPADFSRCATKMSSVFAAQKPAVALRARATKLRAVPSYFLFLSPPHSPLVSLLLSSPSLFDNITDPPGLFTRFARICSIPYF